MSRRSPLTSWQRELTGALFDEQPVGPGPPPAQQVSSTFPSPLLSTPSPWTSSGTPTTVTPVSRPAVTNRSNAALAETASAGAAAVGAGAAARAWGETRDA